MSWLSNIVRPKIRSLIGSKEIPENLWKNCDNCGQMLFKRDLQTTMQVCPSCGYHMRLPAVERLQSLFDEGGYTRLPTPAVAYDPLKFKDRKKYADRLKEAQSKTNENDALMVASGTIESIPAIVGVFNFEFMGGSMGTAVGEAIITAATGALQNKCPLILFTASGGARMQEGMLSLMQMPRSVLATRLLKEAGLPYIVVLTDPTTGGVTASFAMVGDITLAEPGTMIGFAGARVIEETIREKLPEGFQRAEYLQEHGMVDMVVTRPHLKATLARLLRFLLKHEAPAVPTLSPSDKPRKPTKAEAKTIVRQPVPHGKRSPKKPTKR